ncbi:MAG: hypothetical protein U1F98_11565 [Verrucomicrobiota bacterium]
MKRSIRLFVIVSGVILFVTGIAKLIAAGGPAMVIGFHDPILKISYRAELITAGTLELIIAFLCLAGGRRVGLQLWTIAWLSANFAIYRFGRWWLGIHHCLCFGTIPEALGLSPEAADRILCSIIGFLLIGSLTLITLRSWLPASESA